MAENKNVQCSIAGKNDWTVDILTITPYYFIGMGSGQFQFRLKPRTITLNVDIPSPFEPKEGDEAWCLDGATLNGYKRVIFNDFDLGIGFWRTEEEIKQVVAALRGALK